MPHMSWQGYVDEDMVGTGSLKYGAIASPDGDLWACSPSFEPTPAEIQAVSAGFQDPSAIRQGGIYLAGGKYFALKCDDRSIYGKKKDEGCICVKTGQTVLVGIYTEGMLADAAAKTVEELGDYFIEQGY